MGFLELIYKLKDGKGEKTFDASANSSMEGAMNVFALPNMATPSRPAIFNTEICNGCDICVDRCPSDVFIPNPEKGRCPIILHPEECWYCGTCVNDCPRPGAVKFNWPLQQRGYWRRKETGQIFQA